MVNKLLALAVAAVLLGGCGSADSERVTVSPTADDGIFYAVAMGNFAVAESASAMARQSDYVLHGTVQGFKDGRTEIAEYPDGTAEHDRYIVIELSIDEVLKGSKSEFPGGLAYLTRPRGVELYDKDGNLPETGPVTIPVEEFEEAVPIGTKVLVMAPEKPDTAADRRLRVENVRAGATADGTTILEVVNPQSLIVDMGNTPNRGFQNERVTYEDALVEVRAALK